MEMISRLSSYSALYLVRQRIHAMRQSTVQHTIYKLCLPIVRGLGMSMDFPTFSSGKYSWTCVSTVPVAEPIVSFTVPWIGCTIDATATVVTFVLIVAIMLRECLRRDVVWCWFSSWRVLTILFGTV